MKTSKIEIYAWHAFRIIVWILSVALICFIVSALLTGCTTTVSSDGSKSFSIDGEQAARAIEILGRK